MTLIRAEDETDLELMLAQLCSLLGPLKGSQGLPLV